MKTYVLNTTIFLFIIFINQSLCFGQNISKVKQAGLEEVENLSPQIHEICQTLWDYSETALLEKNSSQLLIDVLEKEGFSMEKNIAGMPTAFVATFGS